MCWLRPMLPSVSAEGSLVNELCNSSTDASWYGSHGWRWGWTKPWALLRHGKRLTTHKGPTWIYYADWESQVRMPDRGIAPLLAHAHATSARDGLRLGVDYQILLPTRALHSRPGIFQSHNDQFAVNMGSMECRRMMKRWAEHEASTRSTQRRGSSTAR